MTATLPAQLSADKRIQKTTLTHNGRFLMFELCAQSGNMFHPWNLIRSHTQTRGQVLLTAGYSVFTGRELT